MASFLIITLALSLFCNVVLAAGCFYYLGLRKGLGSGVKQVLNSHRRLFRVQQSEINRLHDSERLWQDKLLTVAGKGTLGPKTSVPSTQIVHGGMKFSSPMEVARRTRREAEGLPDVSAPRPVEFTPVVPVEPVPKKVAEGFLKDVGANGSAQNP